MRSSYFYSDAFAISKYEFKIQISLTTYYTSAVNTSKVLNFCFKFIY